MPPCANCGQENAPTARFCTTCGARLPRGARGAETVRKTVTVVYCDLADSTALGERLDPEVVRGVVTRYFDEARSTLARHGGTVEKFIGDAVMAVFGIPRTHEDDALRAVRAALDLQRGIVALSGELAGTLGVELGVRIGVDTGEVLAGDTARGETFASGDAVVSAERLQRAAPGGGVLVGERTARLVRHAATLEPAGENWLAVAVAAHAPAVARPAEAPLVGRGEELAALVAAFDRAVSERRCRVVTVVGEAGAGKSRLADELRAVLGERATAVEGRCPPYGEGVTYWPVAEILRALAGLRPDEPAATRSRLAALLPDEDWAPVVAGRLAAAIGAGEEGQTRSDEIAWALRRLLESVARERPLLVVLDDVHWAEPTLLDLVEYLAGWSRTAPILVLCLARADLLERRPAWGGSESETVLLRPLPLADTERLVSLLGGPEELDAGRARELAEAAAGNPLFAQELVRMLRDERRRTSSGRVPATIQAVIAARLDLLGDEERAVLQRAAVIGEVFWWSAVAALAPPGLEPRAGPLLQTLVRKELVHPVTTTLAGEDGFRFGHVLVREAAYASIPKRQRAELHQRFADWLERLDRGRPVERDELGGRHLEQAHGYLTELGESSDAVEALARRGSEQLVRAGRRALRLGDMPAAAGLLARASRLEPNATQRRAELLLDLATAQREIGELGRAGSMVEEARDAAAALGDDRLEALAEIEGAYLSLYTGLEGGADELLELAGRSIDVFERADDPLGCSKAWSLVANVHFMRSQLVAMEDVLARALVHAERARDSRQARWILTWTAHVALVGPTPVEQAIRRCEEIGAREPALEAVLASDVAVLEAMRGRFDEARAAYARTHEICLELGRTVPLAAMKTWAGAAELLAGDPVAAERELRWGYETLDGIGERGNLATSAAFLGLALLAQGRDEEAERFGAISRDAAYDDDAMTQVVWRTVLARVGEGAGEALAREAVELAARTDYLNLRGDALAALAEVHDRLGRPGEAAARAREAVRLYAEKGNVVSAAAVARRFPPEAQPESPSRSTIAGSGRGSPSGGT